MDVETERKGKKILNIHLLGVEKVMRKFGKLLQD